MAEKRPMAFMSYAHVDDKFNKGYLTEFCQCLSGEICMHLGEEFPIFLDRKDIKWGDSWKVRIEGSIDGTTFLIPIITPGFFKSQYCRDELSRFLERERTLGRDDLVLPVYFIDTPLLEDEMKRNQDELAEVIASRQYADWRKLRFEELDSGAVRRALAELAAQIREALDGMQRASEDHAPKIEPSKAVIRETKPLERRKPIPEQPTIVVDQWHRGDFTTISQAIKKADPGSMILIRSGIYDEGLILDKPLEIVGDGNLGDVTIRAEGKNAILFKATRGKVANLVLQQMGGGDFFCVDIQQGLLELEGCDITSNSNACVGIHGKASPKLRGNKIHDSTGNGIFVYESGQGLIEDNDIFGNALAGIAIKDAGNPTVRNNKIHDGKQGGIIVYESGQGLIEDNDIFGNALAGIGIIKAGHPTIRGNKIHDGKQGGIIVYESGQGLIEDNNIFGNALSGIEIREAGNPTIRGNKIHDGKSAGIVVWENGQGLIEDNDIFGNALTGTEIREAGNPTIRGNRINKNAQNAVYVHDKGAGTIENNDLRDNKGVAWSISDDSRDLVKRSGNQE
jgi:parallel beta-helix repeat protein